MKNELQKDFGMPNVYKWQRVYAVVLKDTPHIAWFHFAFGWAKWSAYRHLSKWSYFFQIRYHLQNKELYSENLYKMDSRIISITLLGLGFAINYPIHPTKNKQI
ncbi:MAG: hypothetical protein ACUZ8H_16360 [Candidatus Anammoxibacter sp.]